MNDHLDNRKRSRLSKFLTLVLRHQPGLLDAQLDDDGWLSISIDELVNVICTTKENFDWVSKESIIDVVSTDPKGRYEIKENNIRATYGHSVKLNPLGRPDEAMDLPEFVYYAAGNEELTTMLKFGLVPRDRRDRQFLHLSVRIQDAYTVAQHYINYPKLVKINVELACASGCKFKQVSPLIVVSDEVPPQFIEEIPVPEKLKHRKPKRNFRKNKYKRSDRRGNFDKNKNYSGSNRNFKRQQRQSDSDQSEKELDFEDDDTDQITLRAKKKSTIHFDMDDDEFDI